MAKKCCKFTDVDVVSFLREQLERNAEFFQSDFDMDQKMIQRFSESTDKEDKTLFWMSRLCGTHLHREREAFIKDTYDHNTWRFYAEQTGMDRIVAFSIELTDVKDGVIRGNVYELDYVKHAETVKANAVPVFEVEKTFEDGFVHQASLRKMSLGYLLMLSEEHGAVVKSRTISQDEERLSEVLAEQKALREKMREGFWVGEKTLSIDDQISAAERGKCSGKTKRNKQEMVADR